MSVIQHSLFSLFERFPERKEAIRELFKTNEFFKTLCEDHRRCAEALQHWNQSAEISAPERRHEYQRLLKELEEEILQNLDESTTYGIGK